MWRGRGEGVGAESGWVLGEEAGSVRRSSRRTADPMKPVAPVTTTRHGRVVRPLPASVRASLTVFAVTLVHSLPGVLLEPLRAMVSYASAKARTASYGRLFAAGSRALTPPPGAVAPRRSAAV
ncbi:MULTISPECIES: hypothetical protein [Streptomyces]|nr:MULTISPECIES: hypothetical protein [Streptomyces]KOT43196.1 hypothetical protein ADK42_08360 [Streptomyces rimosus subsp. rimosus]KOT64830.1 hypothetical protein ADK45_12785 [Streptomyces rimosus subsp. rimosus]